MASDSSFEVQKLNAELIRLHSEKEHISKTLEYIRFLRQKNKIEQLEVHSKIRELSAYEEAAKEQSNENQDKTVPETSTDNQSAALDITYLDDLTFLDDPAVVNKTNLDLNVQNFQEISMEEESEDD